MQSYAKGQLVATQRAVLQAAGAMETNLTATSRAGTTLTADVSANSKGAYVTLLTTSYNTYGIWIGVGGINASATDRGALLDIAYGAGPTIVIPNIDVGAAGPIGPTTNTPQGRRYYFPGLNIPSGNAIKARFQCVTANQTCTIQIFTECRGRWGASGLVENNWTAYGADTTASKGTSVPQASGGFGTWTQIGTTSSDHNLWQVGFDQLADVTMSAAGTLNVLIEIGVGPNSGAVTSMGFAWVHADSAEAIGSFSPVIPYPTTSGDLVWARLASAETENRGIIMYGC